jgi:hypothetical protein
VAHKARLAQLVQVAQVAHKARLAQLVQVAQVAHKARLAQPAHLVHQDLLVIMVQ